MLFVGREWESRVLARSLHEAASNRGGVVLISGEPGIGKTSLLEELSTRAEAQGFRLARARCAPRDLPGIGSPWLRIIRDCSITEFSEDLALGSWSSGACLTALGGMSADSSAVSDNACGEMERLLRATKPAAKLFHWMQESLEIVSGPCPLLITLDDLHNADELSLDLLLFLTHALHNLPVLVAAAYRPLEISDHSTRQTIGAIQRSACNIEVMPLSEQVTGELLECLLPPQPDPSLVHRIYGLTGGNPLFILEAAFVTNGQGGPYGPDAFGAKIPSTVRGVILERLKILPPGARKLLGAASVIGNNFEPELAFTVAELDREDPSFSLVQLENEGLIRLVNGRSYGFVHGFVRQVAYEEFTASENASLHRRIAAALETHHAHEIETYAGEIAQHLLNGRDDRAREKASDYAEMAGRRFAHAGDFAAASSMYSIAIESMNLHCCADQTRQSDILMALGDAQKKTGQLRASQETFCRAAEIAQRFGDWQRAAHISLDLPEFHWPLPGSSNVLATLLAERALASLPERDVAQRTLVMARVAAELSYFRNERQRSDNLAAGAMQIVQRLAADRRLVLRVLRFRDCVLRHPELISDRLANASEMTHLARQFGEWDALFEGAVTRAVLLFQLGAIDDARAQFEVAEQAAMLANRPAYHVLILAAKAARAVDEGRLAESEHLFAECRKVASAQRLPELADRCWPAMIVPLRERGRLAELEPIAERTFAARPHSSVERAMQCWLALELDKSAEARFHLERLAADDFAALKHEDASLAGIAVLAEVCARLGTLPNYAASLYEFLLPYANHAVVLGQFAGFGAASYYLGKLAMSLSRREEAIAHFDFALEFNRRMGSQTWAAYASVEIAKASILDKPDHASPAFELGRIANDAETPGMERLASLGKHFPDPNDIEHNCNGDIHSVGANPTHPSEPRPAPRTPRESVHISRFASSGKSVSRPSATFRREGDYWTLEYEERVIRLKHLRGLTLIAHLLSRPYRDVYALDLIAVGDEGQVTAEGAYKSHGSDLGPALDDAAKRSYRQRAQELRVDLEQARSSGDTERGAKIEEELRFLSRELARAVGLYGRDRKSGSQVERARLRATNAIKLTIARVSKHNGPLGDYLSRTIRTGTYCTYAPDPDACVEWRLELTSSDAV